MDYALYGSLMTVVMLIVFLCIIGWAWSAKREAAFAAAARMPLEEDAAFGAAGKDEPHAKETEK
jgi:cytochrome c oxidase cbb3-type subunit IV